ncbi:MAG: (d)CMP kinase [Burkholderiales bacterium]|nr:(d)CMP kinase [Burkholderiales bacterium]
MQIITIDGPASSGKGTVAKIIATKLGLHYLESGAVYRVVGLLAQRNNLHEGDVDKMLQLIDQTHIEFIGEAVMINGENVTHLIRHEGIGMLASRFSSVGVIRARLLRFQHDCAVEPGLVTDGRDMGSVVFPEANLKVYLTAVAEVRAQRRFTQLSHTGHAPVFNQILEGIISRDERDSNRSTAPLKFDQSFHLLDNSDMTIDETVDTIISWLSKL